jgi:magnesium chelatase subunit I
MGASRSVMSNKRIISRINASASSSLTSRRIVAVAAETKDDVKVSPARRKPNFPFTRIAGQEDMKLALLLNVVDPAIGGVLIMGDRGCGKSVAVRSIVDLLPEIDVVPGDDFNSSPTDSKLMGPEVLQRFAAGETLPSAKAKTPLVELPLGATEDRICGTIDIEKALTEGIKAYEPGLLAKANRGILYVDEVNLLDDGLVDVVLDSAAGGQNTVEREGVSIVHPAKFIMIGSGNPAEGELRPQLLDRFGLCVNVSTLMDVDSRTRLTLDRIAYEKDADKFLESVREDQEALKEKLSKARALLPKVQIPRDVRLKISQLGSMVDIDGIRGDIVCNRAAAALVALEGRNKVTMDDVIRVASLCLNHRLRKDPLDPIDNGAKVFIALRKIMNPAEAAEEERRKQAAEAAEAEAKSKDKRSGMKAGAWTGLP